MKTLALSLSLVVSSAALAQVRVSVDLPSLVFPAPPRLVVVEPGIQVVEDNDQEVFFVDNFYWHRRNGRWFKTANHNGGWVAVENGLVPGRIVAFGPGKYRHWKGPQGQGQGKDHGPGKGKGKGKH